jgi:hypothetical protein
VSNVLRDLAQSTGHSLCLQPAVWQSLLAVVDADDNGKVDWNELVHFMGDIFAHIERERLLNHHVKEAQGGLAREGSTAHAVAVRLRESQDLVRVQLGADRREDPEAQGI